MSDNKRSELTNRLLNRSVEWCNKYHSTKEAYIDACLDALEMSCIAFSKIKKEDL